MSRQRLWSTVRDPGEHDDRQQALELHDSWARDLLDTVGPRPGDRVLDVAVGTDVVARAAADRVLPAGAVFGVDPLAPGVRLVTAPGDGSIQWRRAHPSRLPFGDESFDVVVCQQALQLLPDRVGAISEMRRVLVPGGRLAVSVWGPIERSPAFAALADSLERRAGVRVAAAVSWLFSLSEPGELRALLAGAGFDGVRVRTARRTTLYPSVAEFLRRYVPGSPVGSAASHMSEDEKQKVVTDLETELAPFTDPDGVRITTEANTGVAKR